MPIAITPLSKIISKSERVPAIQLDDDSNQRHILKLEKQINYKLSI